MQRGGGGNRTRVQGFADLCLCHSATPPEASRLPARVHRAAGTRRRSGAKMTALGSRGWGRGRGIASTALVLVGAFVAAGPAVAAPALPSAHRSPAVATIGTNAVGRIEQTFVDDSRPTKANGSFAGAPNPPVHTTIYYPALGKPGDTVTADATPDRQHGPYPLILYSHGNNSSGAAYEPLLRQW